MLLFSAMALLLVGRSAGAAQMPTGKSADADLLQAIRRDDVAGVRALLAQGAHANAVDAGGTTALILAASRPSVLMIHSLLAAHADVNRQDAQGKTALMTAIVQQAPACIQALVDAGANVNLRDRAGETALSLAYSNVDAAELLLRRGADVNARTRNGDTTLSRAASGAVYNSDNDRKMMRLLLRSGARIYWGQGGDYRGYMPVMIAVLAQDSRMVESILAADKPDLAARDKQGQTALMLAARTRQTDIAALLLKDGADRTVNLRDQEGRAALMYGLGVKSDMAELLLSHGADVNARDKRGRTALMLACQSLFRISALLAHGADVNAQDEDGRTALLETAGTGDEAAARLLLERGANPNLAMHDGFGPLTSAVIQEEAGMFRLLVAHGANVNARNRRGESLLQIARRQDEHFQPGMVALLQQAGAKE